MTGVKAQATVEFMSTYGFMFLLLAIAIVAVVMITTYTSTLENSTCTSYSNLACNFVELSSNTTFGYTQVVLSMTNSQSVPINITGIKGSIGTSTGTGVCSSLFLYPAQETMCEIVFPSFTVSQQVMSGIYNISVNYCNSGSLSLSFDGCIYNKTSYGGAFDAYPTNTESTPFVVIATQIPSNTQLEPEPVIPVIPYNYSLLQNGDMVGYRTDNSISYAFSSNTYLGTSYLGNNAISFPGILSDLNNGDVSCSSPYNSILSIAYSTFYMYQSNTITINAYATNAIQVYYKNQGWDNWVQAFTGSNWNQNNGVESYTVQNTLTSGVYQIAVAWADTCGGGVEAIQLQNVGS